MKFYQLERKNLKTVILRTDSLIAWKKIIRTLWTGFSKKSENEVYIHYDEQENIQGFLYFKVEDETEDYHNMEHPLSPMQRMKIGTFKISENGYYMGERFFKVIFENAIRNQLDEIYVTVFPHRN